MKRCTLTQVGCESELVESKLSTSTSDPFSVLSLTNIKDGFEESVCVKCSNGDQEAEYDNFKVIQSEMCLTSITRVSDPLTSQTIPWSEDGNFTNIGEGFGSFFVSSNDIDCPLKECLLKNQGCASEYAGTRVKMDPSKPGQLTAMQNETFGYKETVCLECSNIKASTGVKKEVISQDNILIEQTTKCLSTLVPAPNPVQDKTVDFDEANPTEEVGKVFNTFFQNTDTVNCPVQQCSVLKAGCQEELGGSSNVVLSKSEDEVNWSISFKKSVPLGYTESICIKCQNSDQTITQDNFSVTQRSKCLTTLSAAQNPLGDQSFSYDSQPAEVGSGYTSFFANSDEVNCPVTMCALKQQGCQASYEDGRVTVGSTSPFVIQTVRNIKSGFEDRVCVECTNGL